MSEPEFPEREILVRCTWESEHIIPVPANGARFTDDDFEDLLEIEDMSAATASLTDWTVIDRG
jgi:hypothetical protein